MENIKFSLYWVADGEGEDWFVISPDSGSNDYHYAELFHDRYEGFEPHTDDDLVLPYSNAEYVCDVPFELMNRLKTKNPLTGNKEITFIEESKLNYSDKELRKSDEEFFFNSIYPDFTDEYKKELEEFNMDYDKIMDFIWDDFCDMDEYCEEVFKDGEANINKKALATCLLNNTITSDYEGYGCVHAQINILKEIEGMTIIDDGSESYMRVVAYNGEIYSEGDMQACIQDAINNMREKGLI